VIRTFRQKLPDIFLRESRQPCRRHHPDGARRIRRRQ
jgi:hypothetical protein